MEFDVLPIGPVAQHELDRSLSAGQLYLLGIIWVQEQSDHIDLLWFALGVRLNRLPRSQNLNILEYSLREISRIARHRIGGQNVDVRTGIEEAGNADDFIGAHRGRAHARRNSCGESDSGTFRSK